MPLLIQLLRNLRASIRRPLREWPSWALGPIGGGAFCIAGYWALTVKSVIGDLIAATNEFGLTPLGAAIWTFVAMLGILIWFHGCVAARCHLELFKRHF